MIEFDYDRDIVEPGRGPDLTPLIDMVFILLVFFLLTSFVLFPSLEITLPETESVETPRPTGLVIGIRADGALLLNNRQIDEPSLRRDLSARYVGSSRDSTGELMIQADRRVPFGRVIEVMDLCRESGVRDISFLVEYREGE